VSSSQFQDNFKVEFRGTSILYAIALCFSLFISYKGFQLYDLYKIQPLGNRPSHLLKDENLNIDEDYQRFGFVFSVIQDLESIIELNVAANQKRQALMFSIISSIKYGIVDTCLYPVFLFLFQGLQSLLVG